MTRHWTTAALTPLLLFGLSVALPDAAPAQIEFDQDVTPDVIFGSGNSNGAFTTFRQDGIELGIRAKIPFVGTTNSNGDGTYSYTLAETDHDNNAGTANRWNFDWTVNTDYDGSSGLKIDDLTYELGMDGDPGLETDFAVFDPVTPGVAASFYDHSIGDNSTANGGGVEAGDAVTYESLIANNNVLQQSWRYAFFAAALPTYDPDVSGTYAVYLLAKNSSGEVVARTDIQVLIGGAPPVGPTISCEGFQPPLDSPVSVNKPNRVLPLRMTLIDGDGIPLTSADLAANPVLQVEYTGASSSSADLNELDSAGKGDDGNTFVFNGGVWAFNLKTKGLASGDYTLSAVSGDLAEYVIAPTCQVDLTVK